MFDMQAMQGYRWRLSSSGKAEKL